MTKRAPAPRPSLSARIVPPCASTIARAIVRPMPLPPPERALALAPPFGGSGRDLDATARRRVPESVLEKVREHLAHPVGVGHDEGQLPGHPAFEPPSLESVGGKSGLDPPPPPP